MKLEDAEKRLIFHCIGGSHAYGTNTDKSDIDLRGVFFIPTSDYFCLNKKVEQVSDSTNDTTYYTIMRFLTLACQGNPNIIELLWTPKDCVKRTTPAWEKIERIRSEFITKTVLDSFGGYAVAQIKKAKGQNKLVHNPMPEKKPAKEDFCWILPMCCNNDPTPLHPFEDSPKCHWALLQRLNEGEMPLRTKSVTTYPIKLEQYHCVALEHVKDAYRLYYYGEGAKGVFRGDETADIIPVNIPLEDERPKFAGVLIYHKDAYEKELKLWHQYWDWRQHRNEARWVDQEQKKLDYDGKNMMHCMRLLYSGENILTNGEPLVRLEGDKLQRCGDIRAGKLPYEEILAEAEERLTKMDTARKTCSLSAGVDFDKINEVSIELHNAFSCGER